MSDALLTQGVKLQRGNGGSPEVFTDVAEITSFGGPGGQATEIDVTHLSSTAKEFKIGLKDEGEFSFEANLIPSDAAQVGLRTDRDNKTLRNFKLLLTDAGPTTLAFAAFVKGFELTGQKDNVITVAITLRISGPVTWS